MSIYHDILKYSEGLSKWKQDILRRLVITKRLSEQDWDEIYAMLLKMHGLEPDLESVPDPNPLLLEHCQPPSAKRLPVRLLSIGSVENVDRLAPNQEFHFALTGLTVVYGDNASGKSGYTRILKSVCRAQQQDKIEIRGNVFKPGLPHPATAVIRYSRGEKEYSHNWTKGDEPSRALCRISIFDSPSAPIYAYQDHSIEYLPQGLDLLDRLSGVLTDCRAWIDKEISDVERRIPPALPEVPRKTAVAGVLGRLIPGVLLKDLPTIKELRAMAAWDNLKERELKRLERSLSEDPVARAEACRKRARLLEKLWREAVDIRVHLSEDGVAKLVDKAKALKAAEEVAKAVGEEMFERQPMHGVGDEPWVAMLRAAEIFWKHSYPEAPLPQTSEDRCPLCMQELKDEAPERMKDFWNYLEGTARRNIREAKRSLQELLAAIKDLKCRDKEEIDGFLAEIEKDDSESKDLAQEVVAIHEAAKVLRKRLLRAAEDVEALEKTTPLTKHATGPLKMAQIRVENIAKEFDKQVSPAKRQEIQLRKNELEAAKILHNNLAAILKWREDLEELISLKKCQKDCATTGIGKRSTKLRRKYFKEGYTRLFDEELKRLNLGHLPITISDKSESGTPKIKHTLDTTETISPDKVLSEGELKGLALAGFLTEVAIWKGHDGIVLDDPVNSLDCARMDVVAERLVEEAQRRQVIVFTHNLVFFQALCCAAITEDVEMHPVWLRQVGTEFGYAHDAEEPWKVKSVQKRIKILNVKLDALKRLSDTSDDEYRDKVTDFYTHLRESWERLVEQVLFNDSVQRFSSRVETQRLKGAFIHTDDYKAVFVGMARSSKFSGHDSALSTPPPPLPDAIEQDLGKFKDYFYSIEKRRSKLEEDRRTVERPRPAKTV